MPNLWGLLGAFFFIPALIALAFSSYLCPKCRKVLTNRDGRAKACPHCGASWTSRVQLVKTASVLLISIGVEIICGLWYTYSTYWASANALSPFRTATVTRGDLLTTIRASGTLEPEEMVDVGAQVTGKITAFGPDLRGRTDQRFKDKTVDFGSPVEEGSLLCRLTALCTRPSTTRPWRPYSTPGRPRQA